MCVCVSHCRFFWHQIQLDPTQLPAHSLVVVGGQDELLHGEEVAQAIAAVAAARAGTLPAAAPDSSRQPSQPTATRADSTPAETDASLGDGASSVQTASHTSNTEQPAAVAAAAAAAADCPLSPLLLTANLVPPLSAYTKLAAEDSTHDTSGRDMQTEGDDSEAVQGQRQGSSVQGSAAVVCVGGRRAGGVCTGPGTKMVYDPDMAHGEYKASLHGLCPHTMSASEQQFFVMIRTHMIRMAHESISLVVAGARTAELYMVCVCVVCCVCVCVYVCVLQLTLCSSPGRVHVSWIRSYPSLTRSMCVTVHSVSLGVAWALLCRSKGQLSWPCCAHMWRSQEMSHDYIT